MALVIAGGWVMTTLNAGETAGLPTPLSAVITQPDTVVAPTAGVPLIVLPESVRFGGKVQPVRAVVGSGKPVVVKLIDPAVPIVNVGAPIAPIVGAWLICNENDCVALGATPLVAVRVSG